MEKRGLPLFRSIGHEEGFEMLRGFLGIPAVEEADRLGPDFR